METAEPDPQALIEPSLEAAEELLRERKYDAAERVLTGLLPAIPAIAYEARVRWYYLVCFFPKGRFSQEGIDHAIEASQYIIQHRRDFSTKTQLMGHIVYQTLVPSGAYLRERSELLALEAAKSELQRESGERQLRDMALLLTAWNAYEHSEVEQCFEELCEYGDDFSLTLACVEKEDCFHRETECRYLDRAIVRLWNTEQFYASKLLVKKMGVLQGILSTQKSGVVDIESMRPALLMCAVNLQLIPENFLDRAFAEYYLGCLAQRVGNMEMAQFHLEVAMAMAVRLEYPKLLEAAKALRDPIRDQRGEQGSSGEDEG